MQTLKNILLLLVPIIKQEQFANTPVNVVYRSNFFNVVDLKVFKAEKVRKFYHLKKSNILFLLPPPT